MFDCSISGWRPFQPQPQEGRWLKPEAGWHPMREPIMKGKVYVMGAGPGDPDLLTIKAVRILRAAEVVLHDDSVSSKILELIPASTQVRNVGKSDGEAGISQEKIHSLLVAAAREGRHVVWLKSNDPLPSTDTDEETEVLAQAGVDFEVIQGAASAMGAAAGANSR
jgi:siroheme synthase